MRETIFDRAMGICSNIVIMQWLQKEMLKGETREAIGLRFYLVLRVNKFQLVTRMLSKQRTSFGTDA